MSCWSPPPSAQARSAPRGHSVAAQASAAGRWGQVQPSLLGLALAPSGRLQIQLGLKGAAGLPQAGAKQPGTHSTPPASTFIWLFLDAANFMGTLKLSGTGPGPKAQSFFLPLRKIRHYTWGQGESLPVCNCLSMKSSGASLTRQVTCTMAIHL